MKHARPHLVRLPGPTDGRVIGLMGGSFDPPHSGHRHVIAVAKARFGLDWVWVIPAAGNPLKKTATPFADRMVAAKMRLAGPRVRVTSIEQDMGVRYTIDLLRRLKARARGARFVLLMGSDNLADLTRWKSWREIAKLVPIGVVSRPGTTVRSGLSRFAKTYAQARVPAGALARRRGPAWAMANAPFDSASSTAIRAARLAASEPPPF